MNCFNVMRISGSSLLFKPENQIQERICTKKIFHASVIPLFFLQ